MIAIRGTLLLTGLALLSHLAPAADASCDIQGLVKDPTGALVANARIALLSPRESVVKSVVSDAGGRFALQGIAPGSYVLAVTSPGFAERRIPVQAWRPEATEVVVLLEVMQLHTEVTVTTNPGSAESVEAVSQSVNVVDRSRIRERAETVLAQSASEETGLHLQRTSPTIGAIYIRGLTGDKVNAFVDGVRYTTSAQRGGINTFFNLMEPSELAAIEVLRGPNSAQYGSDAIGGSIQLLSPSPPVPATGGRYFQGSVEHWFNSADAGFGTSVASSYGGSKLGVQVQITGRRASTLRPGRSVDSHSSVTRFLGLDSGLVIDERLPDTAFTQYGGNIKVNWSPASTSRFTGYYSRSQQDGGKRYDQLLGGDGNLVADLRNLMLDLAYVRWEKYGAGWLDQFSATWSFNSQREERVNQGGNGNPLAAITHEYERTTAHGLQAQARKALSRRHELSLGGEFYAEGIRSPSFAVDPASGSSSTRRGRIPDRARYRSGGVYFQDIVTAIPDRLRLMGSVRASGAAYRARSADSPLVGGKPLWPDDSLAVWNATFRLGAVWSLTPGLNLFGNVSRGFRAPNMTDLGTYGLTGSGYEVAAPDLAGMNAVVGTSAGPDAVSSGNAVRQVKPEFSITYETGIRFWGSRVDTDLALFSNTLYGSITKQALILPPGAVGISLAGQPIIAQGSTGVVYVPAATNPVLVRANYADAQIYGIEHTLDWRVRNNLLLSTIFTWLRSRDTETGSPPNIEGGTPPADGYLKMRYSIRQGRIWIEPFVHAADRQERLSSLDLEDRRTGAGRSRSSIRRFFLNGATARGLVAPGPDARPGTADDFLLATGETVTQVQNRVLGIGVDSAPLFRAVPGYLTLNLRAGLRLGERQDVMVALTNIADRNYRGVSWGLDAPGRSLSVRYRLTF